MTTLLRARITLHGVTPLYDRRNLGDVLDVFDQAGLAPQKWGLDERQLKPYERAATIGRLATPPRPYEQTHLYLRRSASLKYEAALSLWDAAELEVSFEPTPPASEWARVFQLSDGLVERFLPDWGAVGIAFDLRDNRRRAPASGDELDAYLINASTYLGSLDYMRAGPLGLGPRTYVGPFFADQLGRDRIESLPLVVEKLGWGGYRIDLVPEPWAAEISALIHAWRRGMAHLQDANVLAAPVFDLGHVGTWKRGTNVRRRGDR
jgi:hypothetical protein